MSHIIVEYRLDNTKGFQVVMKQIGFEKWPRNYGSLHVCEAFVICYCDIILLVLCHRGHEIPTD